MDPDYDGWVRKPQVGELIMTPGMHGAAPLFFNLDAPHLLPPRTASLIKMLQLLWQNDPLFAHLPVDNSVDEKSLVLRSEPVCLFLQFLLSYTQYLVQRFSGRARVIQTLDPANIHTTGQTSIDIAGASTVHFAGLHVRQIVPVPYYNGKAENRFPPNTTGYMYFQPAKPNRPRLSGELRFRLCSTTDDFAAGEDLKRPDGTVWRVPLFSLIGPSCYRPVLEKIVEEGLVPLELADTLLPDAGRPVLPSCMTQTVLYKLSDPFIYDLSRRQMPFWAVTDEGSLSCEWRSGVIINPRRDCIPTYHGMPFSLSTPLWSSL